MNSFRKKFVLLLLIENQLGDDLVNIKEHLKGCSKEKKHCLYELKYAYIKVVRDPKGLPPTGEVEHEIHFFPNSPLPNIGLYEQSILEEDEVKKQL